ncbi:MAG: peptidoglycan editing factor PgeF [Terriglobia bacterium]
MPWLVHAFSTRRGGVGRPPAAGLNLGDAGSTQRASVVKNRRVFFDALRVAGFSLASLRQIHSAEVFEAGKGRTLEYRPAGYEFAPQAQPERCSGDAMLTREEGVLLSIRTADCLPILIVDPQLRAIAAIHAGWRGALKRVTGKTIGEMRRLYGSKPEGLFAALGPCIRPCCYEVGEEVVDGFTARFVNSAKYFKKRTGGGPGKQSPSFLSMMPPGHDRATGSGFCLDLAASARDQLRSAGLLPSHIQEAGFCTSCRTDLFFSYRKEGSATGRIMAVIGIRESYARCQEKLFGCHSERSEESAVLSNL